MYEYIEIINVVFPLINDIVKTTIINAKIPNRHFINTFFILVPLVI